MLTNINPTKTPSWQKLKAHFEKIKDLEMKNLFAEDDKRFEKFHQKFESN